MIVKDNDAQPYKAYNFAANTTKAMNTLLGICAGLVADGSLNEKEIVFLDLWLRDNNAHMLGWPANAIADRVSAILEDGVVTIEECHDLYSTIGLLLGGTLEDTGAASGFATRLPVDSIDKIEFSGREFCLTGKFVFGTRLDCEAEVLQRGGKIADGVTKRLDYLVIGTLASRDWAHTSHGRKIEKALSYKSSGCSLAILAEENWVKFLQSSN